MMLFKSLIYSKDWTDIVFANRNKEYGAYQLRKMSGKATNIALLIVIATVVGLCTLSFISKADDDKAKTMTGIDDHIVELALEVDLTEEVIIPEQKEEKVQQVATDVSAMELVKFTEINPSNKPNLSDGIAEERELLDKKKMLASFTAKGKQGGELISRGTFGHTKQDGASIGSSLGDIEGDAYGEKAFVSVEIMPEPIGGMSAFVKWIADNYTFPQSALDNGVKGLIQVKFIVEKDGSLSSFEVLRDMGFGTGVEAVHLLKKAKKWNAGIQNGQPVRVAFTLPIRLSPQQ